MSPAGFEPVIPASGRLQTYALDRAAIGIGFDPRAVEPVASDAQSVKTAERV